MEQTTKNITKETKIFYTMIGMMNCALTCKEYLVSAPVNAVHREIKYGLNKIFSSYGNFLNDILKDIPPKDRETWLNEWNWRNRDYTVYQSVFSIMSDMTDEQRAAVEAFAQDLLDNKLRIFDHADVPAGEQLS